MRKLCQAALPRLARVPLACLAVVLAWLVVPRPAWAASAFVAFEGDPAGSATWDRACSDHHPLCVHGAPGTPRPMVLESLASAERAWEALTGAVALPAPDPGADGRWHVFLADVGDEGGVHVAPVSLDPRSASDRAASVALVDRRTQPGCLLDLATARAVAAGSLLRAAPATDAGTARAQTAMLAHLVTPCAGPGDELAAFQANPESALFDDDTPVRCAGAAAFFDWLERNFSREPGGLVSGMWALAPTRTPPAALRWNARPTGYDVLSTSLAGALGSESTLDDVFAQFALARVTMHPGARVAWHVPWPEKARRLASPTPAAPTGASYVLVDHAGAPAGASLRVEAAWEDYGRMRWAVVKLDAAGHAMAVIPIASARLATSTAITVELIDDVDRFVVVGVDVGSTEHPYDPNQGWWEPHGWILTLQAG